MSEEAKNITLQTFMFGFEDPYTARLVTQRMNYNAVFFLVRQRFRYVLVTGTKAGGDVLELMEKCTRNGEKYYLARVYEETALPYTCRFYDPEDGITDEEPITLWAIPPVNRRARVPFFWQDGTFYRKAYVIFARNSEVLLEV